MILLCLLTLFSLFITRRYAFYHVRWLIFFAILFFSYTHYDHWKWKGSLDYLLVMAIINSFALLNIILLLAKYAFWFIRKKQGKSLSVEPIPNMLQTVQTISFALLAGFLAVLFMGDWLNAMDEAWQAFIAAFIVASIIFLLPALIFRQLSKKTPPSRNTWLVFFSGAYIATLFFLMFALLYGKYVADKAEALAKDAPYCIQVSSHQPDYKPASSLLDLSALTMRAVSYWHAVLAVQKNQSIEEYHWSYRDHAFHPHSGNTLIHCTPKPHYVNDLSATSKKHDKGRINITFRQKSYSIPAEYIHSTSSDNKPYITLSTGAPDFSARKQYDQRDILRSVDWHFDAPERLSAYCDAKSPPITDNQLHPYLQDSKDICYLRYIPGENGKPFLTTRARCSASFPHQDCWYAFLYKDWVLTFDLSKEQLTNDIAIQQKLIQKIESFRQP